MLDAPFVYKNYFATIVYAKLCLNFSLCLKYWLNEYLCLYLLLEIRYSRMSRLAASRIAHVGRGIGDVTPYGKRIDRLRKRIFGEVVRATDTKSMKVSNWFASILFRPL